MAVKTVTREFPITMEQDVVICGGGTSGVNGLHGIDVRKSKYDT